MGSFYPLVKKGETTVLVLLHRNREISQLVQTERPPPNCHEESEAQRDASRLQTLGGRSIIKLNGRKQAVFRY